MVLLQPNMRLPSLPEASASGGSISARVSSRKHVPSHHGAVQFYRAPSQQCRAPAAQATATAGPPAPRLSLLDATFQQVSCACTRAMPLISEYTCMMRFRALAWHRSMRMLSTAAHHTPVCGRAGQGTAYFCRDQLRDLYLDCNDVLSGGCSPLPGDCACMPTTPAQIHPHVATTHVATTHVATTHAPHSTPGPPDAQVAVGPPELPLPQQQHQNSQQQQQHQQQDGARRSSASGGASAPATAAQPQAAAAGSQLQPQQQHRPAVAALPPALQRLTQADAPVSLPSPGSIPPASLDNR